MEYESRLEEVVGDIDSGLIDLCMKGMLKSKSFTISRKWLTLAWAISLGSAGPQMSEHQKHIVDTGNSDSSCHVTLLRKDSQDLIVGLTG